MGQPRRPRVLLGSNQQDIRMQVAKTEVATGIPSSVQTEGRLAFAVSDALRQMVGGNPEGLGPRIRLAR
jgi:hypothetical protein